MKNIQPISAFVAALFGLVTLFAGMRVLLGSDPGYVVFRPLVIYNTTMGIVYCAAGLVIWRNLQHGIKAAGGIFFLNLVVLLVIALLYAQGNPIAVDSLRAMSFRTVVWLILFVALRRLSHRNASDNIEPDAE